MLAANTLCTEGRKSLTDIFTQYPKIAGVVGLVLALFCSYLAIANIQETKRLPTAPSLMPISDAAVLASISFDQQPWVEIANGILDCDNLRHKSVGGGDRTQIIITDQNQSVVTVAEYSGKLNCQQVSERKVIGLLSKMSERRYQGFVGRNEFDLSHYSDAKVFMDLCAFCGRPASQAGTVVWGIMALLSLSLYPVALNAHRKAYPK